jgi:hypothetical protein
MSHAQSTTFLNYVCALKFGPRVFPDFPAIFVYRKSPLNLLLIHVAAEEPALLDGLTMPVDDYDPKS